MKQPTIIVEGNRHAVVSIDWFDGKPVRASIMKNGVLTVLHDVSQNTEYYAEPQLRVNLADALEYSNERENALIEHLESVLNKEDAELRAFAYEAMDAEEEDAFLSELMANKKDFKTLQTRVFGMIDVVEEIKAFLEGYYDKGGEK